MPNKKWKCTMCGTSTYYSEYPAPGRCPRNGNGPHSWIQVGRRIVQSLLKRLFSESEI